MKVIYQEFPDPGELDPNGAPRNGARIRPNGPLRFAPLTGVLMTEPGGGLVVRRVRVRVTGGPDRGREALLEAGTLLVGTHADNDLVLRDPLVGKYHLEIALVAGGVRVRDLGSECGTFVAGARTLAGVVPVGTEVVVGRSTLQLLAGDVAVPVSPSDRASFGPVIGTAPAMRQLFAFLERVGPTDAPVLLEGESGTGRTLIAKAIHASSRFAASPMTVIDLGAPVSERPSLSATAQRADTFTLLLERIDEATQADVGPLLALYDRREEGVLDARIIATASSDLRRSSPDDRARKNLIAHVAAVRLPIPPLRSRPEDIPVLIRQFALETCGVDPRLAPEELARMLVRDFPHNVRELRQIVAKALEVEAAPRLLPRAGLARARAALLLPLNARPKPPTQKVAHDRLVDHFERDWVAGIYARLRGNLSDVARETGIPRKDLVKALKRWNIGAAR